MNGTGGSGDDGYNVGISNSGPIETTGTGSITMTGTGGNGNYVSVGAQNMGIFNGFGGVIKATGSGNVTLTGTGGAGTNNSVANGNGFEGNQGVLNENDMIYSAPDSSISAASGNITLTGIGGSGAGSVNTGIENQDILGGGGMSGNITLIADSMTLVPGGSATTAGNITLKPYTAATTVGVGSGTGTLGITDAMLGALTYGSLTVGSSNAGAMDINSTTSFTGPATFISGAGSDITLDGVLASSASGDAIMLASGRNFINGAGANAFDMTGGGRALIYSTNPSQDTLDGLTSDFVRYSCVLGGSCPSFPDTGNGFLYSYVPPESTPESGSPPPVPSTVTLATVDTRTPASIIGGSSTTGSADTLITYDDAFSHDNSYHAPVCTALTADGQCVTAH